MGSTSTTELASLQRGEIRTSSRLWEQINHGHYVRPLDGLENIFAVPSDLGAGHKREHTALSTGIRIRTHRTNFAEDIKAAWISLRYKHPILATQIEDGKLVYHVADKIELNRWLEETFIVHSTAMTGSEVYSMTPRPFKRVVCNVLPHTQEIIFQCMQHLHLDGMGGITLFDNLLRELSNPQPAPYFGDEAKNLLPPFSVLAQIPVATPQQQARWDQSMKTWLGAQPTVRLAAINVSKARGRTKMLSLTFSASSTDGIVLSSRKLGLTVTHAVQAAMCLATQTHGGDTEHKTFPTVAIFDCREYCTESAPDPSILVGSYHTATLITLKLGSFLETAISAREFYVADRADKYALATSTNLVKNFATARRADPVTPRPHPPSAPQLSSFGNLDGKLQKTYADKVAGKDIEVEDFWCTLDLATPDFYVGVWTFRGRLRLQVGYNEVYHDVESIRRWLALVKGELEQGLGVNLEVED